MIRVQAVAPDSLGAALELTPGTELLAVNDRDLEDFLDTSENQRREGCEEDTHQQPSESAESAGSAGSAGSREAVATKTVNMTGAT